jgi:hypothetical protein
MTVEYIDGIKVMTLYDCHSDSGMVDDNLAMLRIWQLLTGGHSMHDVGSTNRRF